MRRFTIMSLGLLLAAATAIAAEPETGKTALSVFTSNLGWEMSHNDTTRTGGIGLALSHAFTRQWSAEIKVAREQHYGAVAIYTGEPPSPIIERVPFHEYPVDLLTHYRFVNGSRWTPYVNGGFRYVSAPKTGDSPNQVFGHRYDLQVGVGTDLRLTQHLGLRFDVNRLVRSQDVFYDPLFRPSLGLKWNF